MYKIFYTKKSLKDIPKLKSEKLDKKTKNLIEILKEDPFKTPPTYEKLVGDLTGAYSRRINLKHRLVYQVIKDEKVVKILSMYTHYGF